MAVPTPSGEAQKSATSKAFRTWQIFVFQRRRFLSFKDEDFCLSKAKIFVFQRRRFLSFKDEDLCLSMAKTFVFQSRRFLSFRDDLRESICKDKNLPCAVALGSFSLFDYSLL